MLLSKIIELRIKHVASENILAHLNYELKGVEQLQLLDWAAELRNFFVGIN
jgi:hypothetical protein